MYTPETYTDLPDPVMQPDFYANVTIKRGVAWVIDTVIILALLVPVVVMSAFLGLLILPFLYLVTGFVYRVATLAGRSATWGMRVMAIEFRDHRGAHFDVGQAFLHTLGFTLSMAFFPVQLVSIAMMCISERGQGLTDMVLGTVALNRRV